MNRKTVATIVITILLLFMMIWSFGSFAANPGATTRDPNRQQPQASEVFTQQSREAFAEEEDADTDPDLGKFASRIDREEYLRARDEYVARRRGIEPGRPFDPSLRGRAIEQM